MAGPDPSQTVDRGSELERLEAALTRIAASGEGELIMFRGAAGAGKTHLLRRAVELGDAAGFRTLSAAGGPLTAEATFGVALELLQPLLEGVQTEHPPADLAPLLPTPAEDEVAIAEAREPAQPASLSSAGLARLCAETAAKGPLLLAVDDVQWADSATLAALEAIARRIDTSPILLLLTFRLGETSTDPEAMSLLTGELLGESIEVGPLSQDGVGRLLKLRGVSVESDDAVARCARLTGGNALLVTRVAAALREHREAATVTSLHRVAAEDAVDVAASVTSQLRRLGRDAGEVAAIAAVLDEHARWRHLVAVSGLDEVRVEGALDRLMAAGILESGEPIRFSHPLVREAVYHSQKPGGAARRHRQAAARLAAEEVDSELVASHLLLSRCEGSPEVVTLLESAARQAMRRGVPAVAATYLERALAEPPTPGDMRARVLILLGRALGQLGREGAEVCFAEAREIASNSRLRAEADLGLGRELYSRGAFAQAEEVLERGRGELGPEESQDEGLAGELRATSLAAARYAGTLDSRRDERLEHLLDGDAPGASRAERSLLAELATELGVQGKPRETVVSLAMRAWADGEMLLTADRQGIAISQVAAALVWSDAYAEADEMLTVAARHSAATGARSGQATARYMRGWVRLYRGDLEGAIADGRAALRADGWAMYVPATAAMVAHAFIELAQLAEAETAMELPEGDRHWSTSIPFALTLEARARLAILRGAYDEALELLAECGRLCLPMGPHHPFSQWRTRQALCLWRMGDSKAAAAALEDELAACRSAGAPRALGMALAVAGMVAGGREGIELAREACTVLAPSGAVLEYARALTTLGGLYRRVERSAEARPPLREALSLADGSGAVALAEQAAAELTAAGGRPRRRALQGPDSLTPAERRTARLAAAGHTNREIAEQLVVTTKTVQFHLSNAYRKLGVASRAELEGAL